MSEPVPVSPLSIAGLYARSVALQDAGRLAEAQGILHRILVMAPAQGDSLQRLGLLFYQSGQAVRGTQWLERAVAVAPQTPEFHNCLGLVLQARGLEVQAGVSFLNAVRAVPDFSEGMVNLARLCEERGELEAAARLFAQAIVVRPELEVPYKAFAQVLQTQGRLDEARTAFGRALALQPLNPVALANLGSICQRRFQLERARACYRMSLCHRPELGEIYNNLGTMLQELGRHGEAHGYLRRALNLLPDNPYIGMNLVFSQLYLPGAGLAEILAAATEWVQRQNLPARPAPVVTTPTGTADRVRRLGFVSADFREHAVGKLTVAVVEGLHRAGYQVMCYSNKAVEDDFTARFRQASAVWRPVFGVDDGKLAELIRDDGVEVLFDLGGFSAENRLAALAGRPAPIQISWVGYPGTTGLDSIDYILADRFQIPHGAERFYSEHVLRLPDSYTVIEPPNDVPPPGVLPASLSGQVTFGSFNGLKKLNPDVLALWSRILGRFPSSRMIIKAPALSIAEARQSCIDLFTANGVAERRLVLVGATSPRDHLLAMRDADLVLDTFPYAGGMTTLECLWMGLPVVTLPGETFCSRHSLSYLSNIGLDELAASDADGYIDLAVRLAGDLPRLGELRSSMRRRMQGSALCDAGVFVKHLEDILDAVWQRRRSGQPPANIDIDGRGRLVISD